MGLVYVGVGISCGRMTAQGEAGFLTPGSTIAALDCLPLYSFSVREKQMHFCLNHYYLWGSTTCSQISTELRQFFVAIQSVNIRRKNNDVGCE